MFDVVSVYSRVYTHTYTYVCKYQVLFVSFYHVLFVFIFLIKNKTFIFTEIHILLLLKTALSLIWTWVKEMEKAPYCSGNYDICWQMLIAFQEG